MNEPDKLPSHKKILFQKRLRFFLIVLGICLLIGFLKSADRNLKLIPDSPLVGLTLLFQHTVADGLSILLGPEVLFGTALWIALIGRVNKASWLTKYVRDTTNRSET